MSKRYGAILADPPWSYSFPGTRAVKTPDDYATMRMDDIAALPVADFAADDCALFCWICWPTMPDALRVIEAWGFAYKTCAFCWVKCDNLPLFPNDRRYRVGMGAWTRANSEVCLLATRGKPKRLNADVPQVIPSPLREHSRKPDEQYERIERLIDGPYLELFARQRWPGWDQWGNEVGKYEADQAPDPQRSAVR